MSGKINNFSIIIPFKTGKQYLIDCLQSVLAQDYPHFEIIVLADITSNTDDTLHAIKDLNNPKISVQLSDKNLDILQLNIGKTYLLNIFPVEATPHWNGRRVWLEMPLFSQ